MRSVAGEWLCLTGVEVACTIGVTERERSTKQTVVLDLELEVDFTDVGVSDDIRDTVDYRSVARRVIAETEASSFQLVETLATHLLRTIFSEYPRVCGVRIEVWKPGALRGARSVGAVIVSGRANARAAPPAVATAPRRCTGGGLPSGDRG